IAVELHDAIDELLKIILIEVLQFFHGPHTLKSLTLASGPFVCLTEVRDLFSMGLACAVYMPTLGLQSARAMIFYKVQEIGWGSFA
ncbi:hypothetical protein ACJX0J_010713, partial [Zea mays]